MVDEIDVDLQALEVRSLHDSRSGNVGIDRWKSRSAQGKA